MKIVVIHGQSHKGSTYHIARLLTEKLGGEVTEFFLPKDFSSFCVGCTNCFIKSEVQCPHYNELTPLTEAIDRADVIILASAVYVYHVTGAMKAFLDHYGYRWMVHRPEEKMFKKQAICISTAAGAGMKSTNKDMADSTFFWGIAKTYKYGVGVAAVSWDGVNSKTKRRIDKKTTVIANKVKKNMNHVSSTIKTRVFFNIMRLMQKHGWNKADVDYWKEKGWTGKARPWKK
ncbi:flavodoxin family protein [Anaeromicropila populeti]|uniref:NADPH-dependent FMN reductase n=1 Tax=Anaeromicropila populeti TaxID=37658 RepID=A0A1I6KQM6_9FIRM|nr:NAD(P)H-dependent oxidoreductase [Anaeromicropila populeti]SFR93562.1 NADPH-dependent FMN reductase [Anaeromicropila populeti]